MMAEGTQSTNQRKHSYVRDNIEVGFFTDPTVCIGCKACEVACKEWNQVPDDGFIWSGNSYDNTGHLGASTWRHVMFLEQDRQKGNQIVASHSLAGSDDEDPFRWVFLSDAIFRSPFVESAAWKPPFFGPPSSPLPRKRQCRSVHEWQRKILPMRRSTDRTRHYFLVWKPTAHC